MLIIFSEKFFSETRLLPGHGLATTAQEEIESNPYLD